MKNPKYLEALLDISQFLLVELKEFLIEEGRFKYRMLDYWDSLRDSIKSMNSEVSAEDIAVYGKVLFSVRRALVSEFHFLRDRKITKADATICIIHRLFTLMDTLCSEHDEIEFRFEDEFYSMKEIIDPLWENIRHPQKTKKLTKLTGCVLDNSKKSEFKGIQVDQFSFNRDDFRGSTVTLQKEKAFFNQETKTSHIEL